MTDTYILNFISFPGNLVLDIFRAPIQIVLGLGYGIIFGLLLWILVGQPQDGESPIVEALVCNAIPLASIFSGLFFGWVTGSEYAE